MSDVDEARRWAFEVLSPLRREMEGYVQNLQPRHFDRLTALGVPCAESLATGLMGVVSAEISGDLWQPMEGGKELLTVGVEQDGGIVDIVAFRPSEPDCWYLRRGTAWALGEDHIHYMRGGWSRADSTIFLAATPMDWLRGFMHGACVINWTPEAVLTLRDAVRIQVSSPAYARALRLELSRPPALPPIELYREQRHAA